jgi:hypothetical protein
VVYKVLKIPKTKQPFFLTAILRRNPVEFFYSKVIHQEQSVLVSCCPSPSLKNGETELAI